MTLRALALDWSVDGSLGIAFLELTLALGALYASAAVLGTRRDRRHRRWPWRRTGCFLGGLAVLVVDLYSGIGTLADTRLSAHMIEHMTMWVVAAPLLVAGAPVRLALFALGRLGRRRVSRLLHSRVLATATGPVGSTAIFAVVILGSHVPVVYGLALTHDGVHVAEHALYLMAAVLMWAPILGVDPLPHRCGPRAQVGCLLAGMVPMLVVGLWLGLAAHPVYGHYVSALGPAALHDQRVAAVIMWAGGLPALVVPALARLGVRVPRAARVQAAS